MPHHIASTAAARFGRLACALAVILGFSQAKAGSIEFKTGSEWTTATDWNPNSVPTSTDNVVIDSGSPTGGSYTINNGTLNVEDLTFSLAKSTTIANVAGTTSTLTLNGGRSGGIPLIEVNSSKNLTISNGASGALNLVLGASGAFDIESSGNLTVSSNIGETGGARALTISNSAGAGTGTVTLSGTNSFSGGLVITGGEVDVSSDANLGAAGGSITINGGRLGVATNNTTIDPTRNIYLGANPTGDSNSGTLSIKGSITVVYNGVMQDLNGSTVGDLVKQGGGTLQLGGANTYSGSTFLNNGITQLTTGNDRLPTGTVVNLGQSASANLGTLDLNGFNQTIAGLVSTAGTNSSGSTNVVTSSTAATLTLNASGSNSYTYSAGTVANSGVISGAISLVKSGTGTQILGGANSYTGTTAIDGGTLTVAGSLTGTGAVTLNNAGSTLASGANATSSVAGSVTANDGTFITPGGAGAVGTFTLGGLTMNSGSSLNMDILGNSNYDQILTSGTLTLGSGTEAVNIAGSGFSAGSFTLVSGYSTLAGGVFTLGSTPGGFTYSLVSGGTSTVLTISGLGGTGNLTWSVDGLAPTTGTDGAGTWTNGSANFYNTGTSATTTWDNTATNNLTVGSGGAGGTITLGGDVRVGGTLTFASVTAPYTIGTSIGTNTLTLAGGISANNSATINAPTILEASQTWSVATGTLTANGAISETGGAAALTKSGAGTLVLANTGNTYSGGTVLSGGVLSVGADGSLGDAAGGLTFNGGTLQTGAGLTSARGVTLNSGGGTVDTNGFDSTLGGDIGGTGALTKNGAGMLTLSGTNTFGGGTTVNAGTLDNAGSYSGATTLAGGTLENDGTISVSGSTVAIAVTGNDATITNLGTLEQTGTGRAIRDNTGVTGLVVNNGSVTNSTALMQTADADVIQMNKAGGGVTLNNYGTMTSLNASAGGSQAVDFNAITTGSNTVNNFSTGIMQASEADAVRPGVNGVVHNDGTIKSTSTTGSSSDGVDAQTNSGIVVVNAYSAGTGTGTGLIEGARHGITGGNTSGDGTYAMSITNNLGGTIQGDNGSGINIDGINANETVTIVNHGTITGDGVTADGDGVDVDGLVNLTNTGTIQSLHAYNDTSEGVTVGGGTITNSGTIEGVNSATNADTTANIGTGRGITIAGVDKDADDNPIPVQAPYAATTIHNEAGGLIKGDSDTAISFTSALTSGFSHTITNDAGATIQTASATAPAIFTGADPVTINNAGTIDGSSSGKAITGGTGNLTVNITGGSAYVLGDIAGGGGTNALSIDPGSVSNTFSYLGAISNFSTVSILSGKVTLTGTVALAGGTNTLTVASGALLTPGLATLTISGGTTVADGTLGFTLDGAAPSSGYSQFALTDGSLTLGAGSALDLELGFSPTTGEQFTLVDLLDSSASISGTFAGLPEGDIFNVDGTNFEISYVGGTGNDLTLTVTAVPEPATWAAMAGAGALGLAFWRRRRANRRRAA